MYEERKNTLNLRDIVLQLLLVILFVFIMIWLFPTKNYLEDNFVGKEELNNELSAKLESLYGRLFVDNIETMSGAAKGYFTNERLPKNTGDSVTLSLKEMLEKKLVTSFKDSNNESCDVDKSYVQVTKMDNEYQMKVQLTCSDYSDYIIVYMGCYEYCDPCDDNTTTPSEPTNPTDPENPNKPVVNKKYMYEYRLDTQNTYSDWGAWSSWSKIKVTANNLRQVEIKNNYEITGYKTVTYIDYETRTEYRTITETVQTGTKKVEDGIKVVDTKPAKATTTPESYGDWDSGTYITSKSALAKYPNKTTWNEYISHKTTVDCSDVCKNVTIYTYKKHKRTYTPASTSYSCSAYGSDYKLEGTNCIKTEVQYKEVPIYETITKQVPETVTVEVEKTKQEPVYGYVKYYRYRTRKQLTVASTYYKWSESKNDQKLLDLGYKLTGKKKEV